MGSPSPSTRTQVLRYTIGATVDLHTEAATAEEYGPGNGGCGHARSITIDEQDAGMGGTQYTVTAWTPCKRGYVLWRQSDVARTEPPFDLLWTLVEGTGGCYDAGAVDVGPVAILAGRFALAVRHRRTHGRVPGPEARCQLR